MEQRTPIPELADAVRRRHISARELVTASLERIDALDGGGEGLNAFVCVDADAALAAAQALDDALAGGAETRGLPLAGIPLGVKDLEDAAGLPTTHGSALTAGGRPATTDSPGVAALRAAGCIVVGKTNTPEDGHTADTVNPVAGRTRNPIKATRTAGGSSGGSAVAVAAGMVPLATGSDGGGSLRIPAAACGITGFKPTNGTVPSGPQPPGSGVLSVRGPLARTAADTALALSVMATGDTSIDPFATPLDADALVSVSTRRAELSPATAGRKGGPVRMAWIPDGGASIDDEVRKITTGAMGDLASAGFGVHERPTLFATDPLGAWWTLWTSAMAARHGHRRDTPEWDLLSPTLQELVVWGLDQVRAADTARALEGCWETNNDITAAMGDADVLVLPTIAGLWPVGGELGSINGEATPMWVRFTYPFNLSRHPVASVVVGTSTDGMPVSIQLVGRHGDDATVLAVASVVESVMAP